MTLQAMSAAKSSSLWAAKQHPFGQRDMWPVHGCAPSRCLAVLMNNILTSCGMDLIICPKVTSSGSSLPIWR